MLLDGQWGFTSLESRYCHPWAEKPAAEPLERERLIVADRTHAFHSAAREEALEVPRACASAPVPTRRLALTVGGASQSHMFQISLLLAGNCVVNLDMPSLCGWSENKAASHLSTGNGRCSGVHCV